MTSDQAVEFADFFADLRDRCSNPDLDLATVRDIAETIHLATREPEDVTYAEVDAGGVEALWCIPVDSDPDAVLLHNHMGGGVLTSMHSDRKAAAHIAKAAGMRSLVLNYRRAPEDKFPAQLDDVEAAYVWLLEKGHRPENIASVGHSIGGNLAVSLAMRLRDRELTRPARSCRFRHGSTSRCPAAPSKATPIRTSCSHVLYWSSFAPRGSTAPAWSGTTRG